jgi:integrase
MARKQARRSGRVEQRGPSRWLVRIFLGRDAEGKRMYTSKTIEGTKKDAETYLASQVTALDQGTFVAPSKQTLGEFLTSWLTDAASQKVSEATLRSYQMRLIPDIVEPLGHLKLDKVTPQVIQARYRQMSDEQKLSPRTVRYTHVILRQALEKAVAYRYLVHNPCKHVELPRKRAREMTVWVESQVSTFLGQTAGHPLYALLHLLFASGLRPSEALAVKWGDLDGSKLRVQRAVVETKVRGEYAIDKPKTAKGLRTVALPEETMVVLQSHRRAQAAEMLAKGAEYNRQDYIFADEWGDHLDIISVRARFQTLVKKSGLPKLNLYGTRHTHATILLRACVNPKVVAERLGHASVVITLDTYSHVLPDTQEEVATKLNGLLFKQA